ncbi:Bromo adjacent homology (BAH) domain [Arabidopsis thaliana x Arabidopsis arenosa]|nr:Bromo adjacent homology (BAH) domain [Arabidopsis thaliana x Arabidopsis arenosa]
MAKTRPGVAFSSKIKLGKKDIKIVRLGDCVLMRPSDAGKAPYVARVEKIEADARNNVKVHCRWYYCPEESHGGRRQLHGAKELFLSDHFDVQSAHTIEGKSATGAFTPDRVAAYCKCEMPYNSDEQMELLLCHCRVHLACVGVTIEEAKKLEHFVCVECSSDEDGVKRYQNGFASSTTNDLKVEAKRRKDDRCKSLL